MLVSNSEGELISLTLLTLKEDSLIILDVIVGGLRCPVRKKGKSLTYKSGKPREKYKKNKKISGI